MKYFYLAPDGTTAGPELLATLCAMMNTGAVSLATLVVPAGGEDWTPLARVLRFFYQDAAGASAGPVAFSELDRLCQIHAIPADAWVVEESGTDWKAAAHVLSAGGVALAAVAPAPRVVHATYRPQPTAAGNPYAAPHAPVAQRGAVRYRRTGGIGRLPYIVGGLLLIVLVYLGAWAYSHYRITSRSMANFDPDRLFDEFLTLVLVVYGILLLGGSILSMLRIQNIGWPSIQILIPLLPAILAAIGMIMHVTQGWFFLIAGLSYILAFIYMTAILVLPPGYARHRRMDAAAWILLTVILLLIAGAFFYGQKQYELRKASRNAVSSVSAAPYQFP